MITLRPYQEEAVAEAIARLSEAPLVQVGTGGGKTEIATEVIRRVSAPTVWLTHTRTLVTQTHARIVGSGLRAGIVMADWPRDPLAPIQVCSVQTLMRRLPLRDVGLVVLDECHRSLSPGWLKVISHYPEAKRVGLTATPIREDGQPLGSLYGCIINPVTNRELVDLGFLVDPIVFVPGRPNLKGVAIRNGDYAQEALEERVNTSVLVGNIVTEWLKRCASLPTIAFAVGVKHSLAITDRFLEAGVPWVHLDAKSPTHVRKKAFADLAAGTIKGISNCNLITEGFDLPMVSCVIDAAPTASIARFLQKIGRGARACVGKSHAVVLDMAGNHLVHGRMTDPREWSLTDEIKPARKPSAKERACRKCAILLPVRVPVCPNCGFVFPLRPRTIHEVDGELVGLDSTREVVSFADRQAFWDRLEADRVARGWKPGASYHKFLARFHVAPVVVNGRLVNTDSPTDDDRREVFKKFAREVLARDSIKVGYAAARYKATFGSWPPFRWTTALEKKREEIRASRLATTASGP